MQDAQRQLEKALAQYTPEIGNAGRALLERLRKRLPGATVLVYDNYNALAIGFAAENRARTAILSIALYPKWINLFFMHGVDLDDPQRLLKGEGNQVRHVPKVTADCLDDERIEALIRQALAIAEPPIDPAARGELIIKSISAKKRSRTPP